MTTMPRYETRFIRREKAAEGTISFFFEKPAGFIFKAGQYADFTLINPPESDHEGDSRSISISSAPFEKEIIITMRMRDSAFKRMLASMPAGSKIAMDGPIGSIFMHDDPSRAAVIIAGGIGITPFRSMIVQAAHDELPHNITLFYSNHHPSDAPFLSELSGLQNKNHNYKMIATMTRADKDEWNGFAGRIDEVMIREYLNKKTESPYYYLAGPVAMATSMRAMLNMMGVDDDLIKSEEYSGY